MGKGTSRLGGSPAGGDGDETEMNGVGSGALSSLTSLWSTTTDKDDTCVQWGLVSSAIPEYKITIGS